MIRPGRRFPAHRIRWSIRPADGRPGIPTALAVLLVLTACSDPTDPTRAAVRVRPNPVVIGVGGGFDDAGNSGSVPGTQWFPTGWAFVPRFGDFGNSIPMHCTTYGRCNAGNLALSLGTLGQAPNPDPNPGPGNTPSLNFGYMSTSAFTNNASETIVVRASTIERQTSLVAGTGVTGKGLYRLAFDYAFLTNAQSPSPGTDPYAVFQLLYDQIPSGPPVIYERVDPIFQISRSQLSSNPALQLAGGCGQGGIGNAVYSLCTGWRNTTVDIPGFYNGKQFVLRLLLQDGGAPYSELDAVDRLIPDNAAYGSVIAFDNFKLVGLPVITGGIQLPDGPLAINTTFTLQPTYEYADPAATHTGSINWTDGTSNNGLAGNQPIPGSGDGSLGPVSHSFSAPGVYMVVASVTDNLGNVGTGEIPVAIYDPTVGFATGAGWINSPAGAYQPDLTATGRAHFAFVSRIDKKNTSLVIGNTSFRFQAVGLTFEGTSYDWLKVAGYKAMMKGAGLLNDLPGYGFLISAIDGDIGGGGGVDKFRIKIWNIASNAVVYDNQLGVSDDADPVTALGGGNISIKR